MKFEMFASAHFKLTNLAILAVSMGTASLVGNIVPGGEAVAYSAAAVIYFGSVAYTLNTKKFHEEFNRKQKIKRIQDLNYASRRLYLQARKYTNSIYMKKLNKVMEDKNDIVKSFFTGEKSYLKERIVEHTLDLVVAYIKLLINYCIRSKELSITNVGEIANRINMNVRKLSFTRDIQASEDLRRLIDMDEKILNRLKDEKKELERITTKIDYMESTVSMFKHQIISNIESEEMLEKLETAVNEATAFDNVLEDRRKNRINI